MRTVYTMFEKLSEKLSEDLLSPLSKKYCMYFYVLTIAACATFILSVVSTGMMLLRGDISLMHAVPTIIAPGLIYINNRLLYGMCMR